MVNFRNLSGLADKAKEQFEKRGGADALKRDAAELKNIATGEGTISEKAKKAADTLKESGSKAETQPGSPEAPTTPPPGDEAVADSRKPEAAPRAAGDAAAGKTPAATVEEPREKKAGKSK